MEDLSKTANFLSMYIFKYANSSNPASMGYEKKNNPSSKLDGGTTVGRVNIAYMNAYCMHLYTLFISLCKYVNNIVGVICLDIIYILDSLL
jgi:hypothetical protein